MELEVIFGIGVVSFEALCAYMFFGVFLEKRENNHQYLAKMSIYILVTLIYLVSLMLAEHIVIKAFLVFILFAIVLFTGFKSSLIAGFLFTVVYQGMLLALDELVIVGFKQIKVSNDIEYLFMILISKMLLFLVVISISKRWNNKDDAKLLSDSEWIQYLYFPVLTVIIILLMAVNLQHVSRRIYYTMLSIAGGLIIMNLILLSILKSVISRERRLFEITVAQKQAQGQIDMYRIANENFQRERKKTHEYKNHLTCLNGLLHENSVAKAVDYLNQISGVFKAELDIIDTKNPVVNIIINTKYQEAEKRGIVFILKVNDLSNIYLRDEDIVVLLSNLLNNAIEACEQVQDSKKKIWFKFTFENNEMIIAVKNSIDKTHQLIKHGETLLTTKANSSEHGIGIENVKSIVKKYNGDYIFKTRGELFVCSIIIPCN